MVATRQVILEPVNLFLPSYIAPPFVAAVQDEIISIKERDQRKDMHFFSVRTYRFGREDPWSNEVFWAPLEQRFNTPLVILENNAQRDYRPIGDMEYMFISCGYVDSTENKCPDVFLAEFPDYRIEKQIYINPTIYVAKRHTIDITP